MNQESFQPLKNEETTVECQTENGESVTLRTDKEAFDAMGIGHLHCQLGKNFRLNLPNMEMGKIRGIASKFGNDDHEPLSLENPNQSLWIEVDGAVIFIDKKSVQEFGLKASE